MALESGPNLGLLVHGALGEQHYNELMRQFRGLDALVQCVVVGTTNTPPGSPTEGAVYQVGAAPTGAWASHANKIARWTTKLDPDTWEYYTPKEGWRLYDQAANERRIYSGSAWTLDASGTLASLTDVDMDPAPTDGQVLTYNESTGKWEPVDPSGGGGGSTTLAGLTDVDMDPVPTNGQSLVFNATTGKWEPGTVSGGGTSTTVIAALEDTGPGPGGTYSGSAYAMKGNLFDVAGALTLYGVKTTLDPTADGDIYKIEVYSITGGSNTVIAKLGETNTYTAITGNPAVQLLFTFATPIDVAAGTRIAVVAVLTNRGTTGVSSVAFPGVALTTPWAKFTFVDNVRVASAGGATAGTALTNSGTAGYVGMSLYIKAATIPTGGSTTLAGLTDVDMDPAPTNGQVLKYNSATGKWEPAADGGGGGSSGVTINDQTGTSYTLVLADAGAHVRLSNVSPITLTVPTNASVALPVGSVITGVQGDAGQVTITAASGVTVNKPVGATATTRAQYAGFALVKVATNTWELTGDLVATIPANPLVTAPPQTGWSWVNQGTCTLQDSPESQAVTGAGAAPFNFAARVRALPAAPYTITACVELNCYSENYLSAGLVLRNSSSGLQVYTQATPSVNRLTVSKHNSPTSFNSDYTFMDAQMFDAGVVWWKIQDDGTNRIISVSRNGRDFVPIHSVARTDFVTPDQCGFGIVTQGSASRVVTGRLVSWKVE